MGTTLPPDPQTKAGQPIAAAQLPCSDFAPPFPLQFKGSPLAGWILGRMGWRVRFEGLPAQQGLIVVYPHTSNWDFVVGILTVWTLGLPVQFWGKDTLFKIPLFGPWLRWIGGIPVVRGAANGVVDSAVKQFQKAQQAGSFMWVALAPEGTRKRANTWRSGFYQTALRANLPLGIAHLDFGKKLIQLTDFIVLTGDRALDIERLQLAYRDTVGLKAENASPIALSTGPTTPKIRP